MYDKSNFLKILETVVTTFVGVLGGYILQSNSLKSTRDWVIAGFVFMVISFIVYSIHFVFANKLHEKLVFIRRWFSKDFIEGTWVQIIYDDNLKQMPPTKYSLVRITVEDGAIKITGASYNQDNEGDQMTNFISKHSSYNDNELIYYYSFDTRESSKQKDWFGRCRFFFSRYGRSRYHNKYEGEVSSNIRTKPILVRAIRVKKKMNIDIKTKEGRINIDKYIKQAF